MVLIGSPERTQSRPFPVKGKGGNRHDRSDMPPFPFSVGELKIMNHFVVSIHFALGYSSIESLPQAHVIYLAANLFSVPWPCAAN
jgi:hypothetical protein